MEKDIIKQQRKVGDGQVTTDYKPITNQPECPGSNPGGASSFKLNQYLSLYLPLDSITLIL